MDYIEIEPPAWECAVLIYCDVLTTPTAGEEAHCRARDELLRLARAMDAIKARQLLEA
jgi:hypothetical protein|tara:strand:- start:141 stop:314 length:174 start_codon:yes stop_codon:yes gene_type:complete